MSSRQVLGRGCFGETWLIEGNTAVVVKSIHLNTIAEPKLLHLLKLNHPNITKFNEISLRNDHFEISIEFCERGSLHSVLFDQKIVYSMKTVLTWAEQLFSALLYLEFEALIHGNIKPNNVLVTKDFMLKLTDLNGFHEINSNFVNTSSTSESFKYQSPEIVLFDRKMRSYSCDLYSTGLIIWEMIERRKVHERYKSHDGNFTAQSFSDDILTGKWILPLANCQHEIVYLIDECTEPDSKKRPKIEVVEQAVRVMNEQINIEMISNRKMLDNSIHCLTLIFFFTVSILAYCPKSGENGAIDGYCYFAIDSNYTYPKAQGFCDDYFDAKLASIQNAFDNQLVLRMVRNVLELNLDDTTAVWLGGTWDGHNVFWEDGTFSGYVNMASQTDAPGNLVMNLVDGKWRTTLYNHHYPFVCLEKNAAPIATSTQRVTATTSSFPPATARTTTASPTTGNCSLSPPCPSEWTYSDKIMACYKVISNVTFDDANSQCKLMGSQLASVLSAEENRIINELLTADWGFPDPADFPLIGARKNGAGPDDWLWIDGSPWGGYVNWAQNAPDFRGREYCMQIFSDIWTNGPYTDANQFLNSWSDVRCDLRFRKALCKRQAVY
ncbi:unnamed protein product, partial [Mesorhabditis belari]|uniref:Uncharacterized protein n=1 Tax=Mesorhabditis belari TaxID=2138241 RepID=A0AAF3EM43_9BILA